MYLCECLQLYEIINTAVMRDTLQFLKSDWTVTFGGIGSSVNSVLLSDEKSITAL